MVWGISFVVMLAPRGSANNGRCQGAKQRFMQQQPSQDIASADMFIDNYAAGVFRRAQNTDRCFLPSVISAFKVLVLETGFLKE